MRAWKRLVSVLALAALAGCGGPSTPAGGPAAQPAGGLQVGMVTDTGGIDDLSFNMMAWRGLAQAEKELGVKRSLVESRQVADYASNLERLAEKGCKLVLAVGFAMEPALKDVAPRYPQTQFAIIDAPGPQAPNVAGLTFREEEGSFLVGALAGGMSKSNTLGFVGGMEIQLIKKFEAGYRAGIQATNPRAKVVSKYTNNWEDVSKGKELALSLYGQGADVVMHASGRCGLGVIEAAKEKGAGFWAIGVDADQDYLGAADPEHPAPPSRVLTSMLKRVDNAVLAVCREAVQGSFKPGPREFGVKEDGVGLSPLQYTKDAIPEPLLRQVEELKKRVAAGEIRPPKTMEELATWKAPAVTR